MTNNEIEEFWEQVWIQFPTMKPWLENNSEDMAGTLAIWSRALVPYTAAEVLSVLYRWSKGDVKPPAAYERESFAIKLIDVIKEDRNKKWMQENKGAELEKLKGRKVSDAVPGMEACIAKVNSVKARYDQGMISEEELNAEVQSLVDKAHRKIDGQRYYKAS